MSIAVAVELEGMPERFVLERTEIDNDTIVSFGPRVLFCYPSSDRGLRNLAVVTLSDAGVPGIKVAEVFGLSPEYVSRLRGRAKDAGSASLVRQRGAHRKLSGRELARVRTLARSGCTQAEIATRCHVSQPTISRVLSESPGQGELVALPFGEEDSAPTEASVEDSAPTEDSASDGPSKIARIEAGEVPSRYTGAMLLHHFLSDIGVEDVLSSLPRAAARRYDVPAVMLSAIFGFALGASSAEGTKHVARTDAGALLGLASFPELRTLRPGLAAIAEQSDPLRLQRAFAAAMLNTDEHPPRLYFVDDHFVTYTGARAVAKGWNTRKRMAERGRDDTFVVDDTWRAICFSSFEPKGLVVNLPPVIDQLLEICGKRPIMLGFDRGAAYPKVFSALRERGVDWVTYRRAPLVTPAVAPRISWVKMNGKRLLYHLADEIVELACYGKARQLSLYEHDRIVFQILTSDTITSGARLLRTLRARWCIENTFKYLTKHPQTEQRLLELFDTLDSAEFNREDVRAFCRIFAACVRAGQQIMFEKTFMRGSKVGETRFHNELERLLLEDPELGGRLTRRDKVAGGFDDLLHDDVIVELKAPADSPITIDKCTKYLGQPAQYGIGRGSQLSTLVVLDHGKKDAPPGVPENYIGWLRPKLHGLGDPRYPTLVGVLVINTNLPIPSAWSRHRIKTQEDQGSASAEDNAEARERRTQS